MNCYIKGYYGYKNFGDELLLLGVLEYLVDSFGIDHCIIETPDATWLDTWMHRHAKYFPKLTLEYATGWRETTIKQWSCDMIVIGGGEVVTDARSFPHNGRNYLLRNYWQRFFGKKIILLGGFGNPLLLGSKILHSLLYRGAYQIICREQASYERVLKYVSSSKALLHQDFSYSILRRLSVSGSPSNYAIVNCNPYIWSPHVRNKIVTYCVEGGFDRIIYFPAELSIDQPMYVELQEYLPKIERYDRTQTGLEEIATLFANASGGIAARLHVLILLDFRTIPYIPLVYQEKITKILGHE